jgi:hypothetical protein
MGVTVTSDRESHMRNTYIRNMRNTYIRNMRNTYIRNMRNTYIWTECV